MRQRTCWSCSEKILNGRSSGEGVLGGGLEMEDDVSDKSSGIEGGRSCDRWRVEDSVSWTGSSTITKSSPGRLPNEIRTESLPMLLTLLSVVLEIDEVSWLWKVPVGKNSGVSKRLGSMVPPAMTISVSDSGTKGWSEHSKSGCSSCWHNEHLATGEDGGGEGKYKGEEECRSADRGDRRRSCVTH